MVAYCCAPPCKRCVIAYPGKLETESSTDWLTTNPYPFQVSRRTKALVNIKSFFMNICSRSPQSEVLHDDEESLGYCDGSLETLQLLCRMSVRLDQVCWTPLRDTSPPKNHTHCWCVPQNDRGLKQRRGECILFEPSRGILIRSVSAPVSMYLRIFSTPIVLTMSAAGNVLTLWKDAYSDGFPPVFISDLRIMGNVQPGLISQPFADRNGCSVYVLARERASYKV